MSEIKQSLEEALFELAAQKPNASERAAFLDGVCRDNPALRGRLDVLLEGHFAGAGFLTQNPERDALPVTVVAPRIEEAPAQMIGRYKLLEQIGEGGFGEVWMAEQREPVKRRVALKLIKLGMDSRQIVARFEAERQALAMMDHANIAKVFDAGATDTGRPYFVMELVRGIKITEYCDKNTLSTHDRLKLFILVCQAIQHAHQKGIIHRDIKPSNILVTLHDGVPVPKVIDFGIAKATQQELTDKTVFTQFQQFIGTPAYISPEQAEMSGLDIDTRADIYSLGVLLYELLVGQTPFDAKEMMQGGLDALRQIIREREPLRPSTKLNTLAGDARTTAGKRRHTDVGKLVHQLQGDLDWIVMKCLEKDRTRRYDSATGLAADLQRHLSNEPVVARPPSTAYKLQKAWQRNKLVFSSAGAVALALVVALLVSSWQMVAARRTRNNEAAQRTKAEASEKSAVASARDATASLYGSLLGQASATRIARQVGFREEVFALLRQARDLDTPAKQLAALRLEAVASMGDFVGVPPRLITSPPTNRIFRGMRLSPDGRLLAVRDANGGIQLRELPSGREVGRWQTDFAAWDFVFNRAGDRLLSIHIPEAAPDSGPTPERMAGSRVAEFAPDLAGKWQQMGWRPMPGAFGCVCISNSVFVAVAEGRPFRQLHLVEPGSGRTVHSLSRSEGAWAPLVAATRNGQMLALIGFSDPGVPGQPEPQFEIWNLPRQQIFHRLQPGFSTDPGISFSEDDRHLLISAKQGTRIYETKTFNLVDEFSGLGGDGSSGSFLTGTPLVAVPRVQQDRFLIRDHQKQETAAVLAEGAGPVAAAFAPAGEFLVTCTTTAVRLYPFAGADECRTLAGHAVSVPGIAFSPEGRRLASVAKDRTVTLWDADSGRRIWDGDRPLPSPGQAVCFSPDGKLVATGDWLTPHVQLWDAESGRQVLQLTNATAGLTWSLQFVTDPGHGLLLVRGSSYYTSTTPDCVSVWHMGSAREVLEGGNAPVRWLGSRVSGMMAGLVAAPAGKTVAFLTMSPTGDGSTIVQDALGEKPPMTLARDTTTWSVQPLAFTPDGQSVIVLTTENRVAVFDAATGELRRSFAVQGPVTGQRQLALSPTGRWLAVASPSKRGVDIHDFATGELLYALPDREGTVYWLAWQPGEPRLAIARDNGDIALWDLAKVERQLKELGLGFASVTPESEPAKDKP